MGSGSGIQASRKAASTARAASRASSASSPANRGTNTTPSTPPAAQPRTRIRRVTPVPNEPTEVPVRRIRRRSAGGSGRSRG